MTTTKAKPRPKATLAVDDLDGLSPMPSFAARLRFLAQIEYWNTDDELVAALGKALTARDAQRQARSTLGQAAAEAGGFALQHLDDAKYCGNYPSETVNRLRDLRLASNRLDTTRKQAVINLTVLVDRAIASPQVRAAAAHRVTQAEELVRQATAAMDAAESLLDDAVSSLNLSGPLLGRARTALVNGRMAGDDRSDWLAAYCTAVSSELATEDQEAIA